MSKLIVIELAQAKTQSCKKFHTLSVIYIRERVVALRLTNFSILFFSTLLSKDVEFKTCSYLFIVIVMLEL